LEYGWSTASAVQMEIAERVEHRFSGAVQMQLPFGFSR